MFSYKKVFICLKDKYKMRSNYNVGLVRKRGYNEGSKLNNKESYTNETLACLTELGLVYL